jgi:hypothetical protein
VVSAAISAEHQQQLLGAEEDKSYAITVAKLFTLLDGFDEYLDQQITARHYDVVF